MARRTPEQRALLDQLKHVARGLGETFAPFCEVVLHDLSSPKNSIIAIENNLSGRDVGDPTTELGLARIADNSVQQVIANYANRFADGRPVKSTSIGIKDANGAYVAALCLNIDLSLLHGLQHALARFGSVQGSAIAESLDPANADVIRTRIDGFSARRAPLYTAMPSKTEAMTSLPSAPTYDDVCAAARRIDGHAHRTPVLTSRTADELIGARVFFKCENFQRMGAFKFRGAFNALSRFSAEQRRAGVITFSSGNHAQAVALAGKILDVKTLIVMPANAPQVKLDATRGYGAEVVLYQKDEKREEVTSKLAKERNLSLIPPFDHPQVIAGQGTAAKELIEDAGPLDYLLVPCGGAGLLSGCAIAARHMLRGCKVRS